MHIGARVSALAGPNDVLVSSTLRDLVIGQDSSSKTAALTSSRACPASGTSSPSRLRSGRLWTRCFRHRHARFDAQVWPAGYGMVWSSKSQRYAGSSQPGNRHVKSRHRGPAGFEVLRFLAGIPERTYRRRLAWLRHGLGRQRPLTGAGGRSHRSAGRPDRRQPRPHRPRLWMKFDLWIEARLAAAAQPSR